MLNQFLPHFLLQLPPRHAVILALLMTAGIGVIDYVTGVDVRVFPLYFVPVALLAGTGSERGLSAGTLLGAAAWTISNHEAAQRPAIYLLNVLSQSIAFFTVAFLVFSLRRREEQQRKLAHSDPLTGLLNARAFHTAAKNEIDTLRRTGRPLTAAYLDLDNFKNINTTLGHVGADKLLVTIAHALAKTLRGSDHVSRLAGDEFAVLLPGAGDTEARLVLSRLHDAVSAATESAGTKVTFSMGALTFASPPSSVESMLSATDALMYKVKAAGKNQLFVETAPPSIPPSSRRK